MKNDKAPVCGIHGIKKAGTCVQQRPANPNVQRCHPFWSATTHTIFSLVWITNPNPKKSAVFSCYCSTPTIPTPQGIRNPTTPHKEIALSIPTRKSLGRCTHLDFAQANKETLDQVLLQHSTRPLEGERKSTHNSQSGECVYMQPVSGFQYNQTSRGGVMGLYAKWTR